MTEAELRVHAEHWGLARIHVEDEYAVLTYKSARRIEKLGRLRPGRIRVADDRTAYVPLEEKRPHGSIVAAVLRELLCEEAPALPPPPRAEPPVAAEASQRPDARPARAASLRDRVRDRKGEA